MSIRLGITLGDVNGIGPEIVLKAVNAVNIGSECQFVLIGPYHALCEEANRINVEPPPKVDPVEEFQAGVVAWDPAPELELELAPGRLDKDAAQAAYQSIRTAVGGAICGKLDAMVTAPINKEGFQLAGVDFPGHTELLARLTGVDNPGMLLQGGGLRVLLVTRHLPLKDVAASISQTKIMDTIKLAAKGLDWMGVEGGKIGVCGLNPHAGDGGLLGDEEIGMIAPAIEAAKDQGFQVEGPIPSDTIFYQALQGKYDLVVAMYHDQGLGPLKMVGFEEGLNVTLGLPIIRTSPDHGTAYDIAGQGRANPASMVAAIDMAAKLVGRPNPWFEITRYF